MVFELFLELYFWSYEYWIYKTNRVGFNFSKHWVVTWMISDQPSNYITLNLLLYIRLRIFKMRWKGSYTYDLGCISSECFSKTPNGSGCSFLLGTQSHFRLGKESYKEFLSGSEYQLPLWLTLECRVPKKKKKILLSCQASAKTNRKWCRKWLEFRASCQERILKMPLVQKMWFY